ncbi:MULTISPECIES: type II toxin-antitoxin system VapC family toxin [unclassified Endozoicomonas]|uniref:type II toxin-antitoxin system VapC family toxin n=1 Tax=unclassified Endozoicomonas TaxID=2644528 RepID=UPI002148961C
MYLLDTNVISELRKAEAGKSDIEVLRWLSNTSFSDLYISSISILELEIGILQMERKDKKQGASLRSWMDKKIKVAFEDRVLSFDGKSAVCAAEFHVPDPKSERDAMIAGIAKTNQMLVVTRNVTDFSMVRTLNPWDSGQHILTPYP